MKISIFDAIFVLPPMVHVVQASPCQAMAFTGRLKPSSMRFPCFGC
jgi:hypothetical protein